MRLRKFADQVTNTPESRASRLRSVITQALFAVVVAWLAANPAAAQSLQVRANHVLRVEPDSTTVLSLPIDQHWQFESQYRLPSVIGPAGLKLGVGGGYGWTLTSNSRIGVLAGIGLTERNPTPITAGRLSGFRDSLQTSNGMTSYNKDLRINLHLDWQISSALALTSGVGLSVAVGDGPVPPGALNLPFGSSTGYVGLKLRF
jgi:hypothetical protein